MGHIATHGKQRTEVWTLLKCQICSPHLEKAKVEKKTGASLERMQPLVVQLCFDHPEPVMNALYVE